MDKEILIHDLGLTGNLRWHNGVLQQERMYMVGGAIIENEPRYEKMWVDVPTEDGE